MIKIIGIETDEGVTHFQCDAFEDEISSAVFYAQNKLEEDDEHEMFFNNIKVYLFTNTKATVFQHIEIEIY